MKSKGLLIILLLILITGCRGDSTRSEVQDGDRDNHEFISERVKLTGEILNNGYLMDLIPGTEFEEIEHNGEKYLAIDSVYLMDRLIPTSVEYEVYVLAEDGFMVSLSSDTLEDTFLGYHKVNGWCFLSDKHPVNSRVKHVAEWVVVNENVHSFNIIANEENHYMSLGQLRLGMNEIIQTIDGVSTFNKVSIEVMKRREVMSIDRLLTNQDIVKEKALMIYTRSGEVIYDYGESGYLEVNLGGINYIKKDLSQTYIGIHGIVVDPPPSSIKDHYEDVIHYLDNGKPVLTLFIDGFSYDEYTEIISDNEVDFMDSLEGVNKSMSLYKPVTNVGFAAMITGEDPFVNGVHSREYREVKVPTLFDYCEENGLKHGLIEGDIRILNLNTTTVLNLDSNENGMKDDEIFQASKDQILEGYDYLMVHFHSVDEFGHTFGPNSKETLNQLKLIDSYIEELVGLWQGKVMIIADHGMHSKDSTNSDLESNELDQGDHGLMCIEDLMVPYVIINGGINEKE